MDSHGQLVAPLRFACVEPNLYRGNYPGTLNLRFIQRLGLKTILSLTPEPLGDEISDFTKQQGIRLIHVRTEEPSSKSKKKRGVPVSPEVICTALEYMLDAEQQPMYVHCINGSQVTCLLIGCLRRLSFWSISAILDEFVQYSELGNADQQFIEQFHAYITKPQNHVPWLWKGLNDEVVKSNPCLTMK